MNAYLRWGSREPGSCFPQCLPDVLGSLIRGRCAPSKVSPLLSSRFSVFYLLRGQPCSTWSPAQAVMSRVELRPGPQARSHGGLILLLAKRRCEGRYLGCLCSKCVSFFPPNTEVFSVFSAFFSCVRVQGSGLSRHKEGLSPQTCQWLTARGSRRNRPPDAPVRGAISQTFSTRGPHILTATSACGLVVAAFLFSCSLAMRWPVPWSDGVPDQKCFWACRLAVKRFLTQG